MGVWLSQKTFTVCCHAGKAGYSSVCTADSHLHVIYMLHIDLFCFFYSRMFSIAGVTKCQNGGFEQNPCIICSFVIQKAGMGFLGCQGVSRAASWRLQKRVLLFAFQLPEAPTSLSCCPHLCLQVKIYCPSWLLCPNTQLGPVAPLDPLRPSRIISLPRVS